jgi:hypothetical protein
MSPDESKKRRSPRIMVSDTFQVKRRSHVPELCRKRGLGMQDFVRDAGYHTRLSRPTLEKAFNGSTELDYDVIEKLAWFFGVETNEVLESVF